MKRRVQFRFHYPGSIFGIYDTGSGVVFIFGDYNEGDIEEVLSHETLHWAVQKLAGKDASIKLDNVSRDMFVVRE